MTCRLCATRPIPNTYASPRKCAFYGDRFTPENWNCETMNELRKRCRSALTSTNEDRLLTVDASADGESLWIVLMTYKNRGCVESAGYGTESGWYELDLCVAELALARLRKGGE